MLGFGPAVEHGTRFRAVAGMSFLAALAGLASGLAWAQAPPASPQQPPAAPAPLQREAAMNAAASCVQPAPNGSAGRLRRAVEEGRGHVRPAVGTQSGAPPALQARLAIVHAQTER